MKTLSASLKALVVASLACAAGFAAAATDTQTLTVSAKVTGTCKFSSKTNSIAFGTLDQSVATDVKKDANIVYRCTTGTASLGIAPPTGTLSMAGSVSGTLPFTLSVVDGQQTGLGMGTGGDLTAVVTGTITGDDVQAAVAGDYTTDVTLTMTY